MLQTYFKTISGDSGLNGKLTKNQSSTERVEQSTKTDAELVVRLGLSTPEERETERPFVELQLQAVNDNTAVYFPVRDKCLLRSFVISLAAQRV
ncbi:hypothetical protein K0M31_003448 [Melipona bicolor]|uniref:Uncharacterized protein n=1 Tax=Melipona bicolor TaxID=60889 RepID=A0AA40FZN2_9HYME|nr:hypothetical protein K0M31_003448 [Melipona bicolor]